LLSKQYLFLFQPHVLVGLPCYDFILVLSYIINRIHIKFNIVNNIKTKRKTIYTTFSDKTQSQHVTGGVQGLGTYSPKHTNFRLLVIPPSCERVTVYN